MLTENDKEFKKRCIKVLRCSLTTICPQTTSFVLYNWHAAGQFKPTEGLFVYLFIYFFLHLFILQAIYIVLQDLKMKMLFVELNIRLQE